MSRIEFPSTPIGAKPSPLPETHGEVSPYHQAALEGLEQQQVPEIELGNCLIITPVTFKKRAKGNEWQCHIIVEPDLIHPEQEGGFEAFARNGDADRAHRSHLKPGDRATIKGSCQAQVIHLENGDTTTLNRFYVTAIEIISRSPRKSTTVYEQKAGT